MENISINNIKKLYEDDLDTAEDLALQTHFWQTRRDGSTYLNHLKRTQLRVRNFGYNKRIQILAILHDALEDGANPKHVENVIRRNFKEPEKIIQNLKLLTHAKGADYSKYVLNVYNKSKDAFTVKMVDMLDNISDNPMPKQFEKYRNSIIYLINNGVPKNIIPKKILEILKLEI